MPVPTLEDLNKMLSKEQQPRRPMKPFVEFITESKEKSQRLVSTTTRLLELYEKSEDVREFIQLVEEHNKLI